MRWSSSPPRPGRAPGRSRPHRCSEARRRSGPTVAEAAPVAPHPRARQRAFPPPGRPSNPPRPAVVRLLRFAPIFPPTLARPYSKTKNTKANTSRGYWPSLRALLTESAVKLTPQTQRHIPDRGYASYVDDAEVLEYRATFWVAQKIHKSWYNSLPREVIVYRM